MHTSAGLWPRTTVFSGPQNCNVRSSGGWGGVFGPCSLGRALIAPPGSARTRPGGGGREGRRVALCARSWAREVLAGAQARLRRGAPPLRPDLQHCGVSKLHRLGLSRRSPDGCMEEEAVRFPQTGRARSGPSSCSRSRFPAWPGLARPPGPPARPRGRSGRI